ncbi:peptidoglycan-binding protein [Roseobacter sp. HKCCA0434]|uniref:peptidoglycan-binding protein n=1 Tax=Roseobacter sp. HKCCA0434 TaxID=3079297 RepID=UPI002905F111|nr:peptidoglycan-binding protein [Roseobacter sp. HKCCA0434]
MNRTLAALLTGTAFAALAGPAAAQNVALVIGNSDYENADTLPDDEHDSLVSAYTSAGYEVVEGENLSRSDMFNLLRDYLDRAEGADRVVVHLNGVTVTTDNETWFLPVDARDDTIVRTALSAPTLDLFLSFAADAQEHGAVFVGTDADAGFEADDFEGGVGSIYTPRDTIFLSGEIDVIADLVRDEALSPGMTLRDLVRDLPDGVQRSGFGPRGAVLVDERQSSQPDPEPLPQVVETPVPQTPQQPEPRNTAEETEDALNLTRAQRTEIQEDLTILGYNTRGVDGIFGSGSRSAIAGWQTQQNFTSNGFLTRGQIDLLAVQADNRRAEQQAEQQRQQATAQREDRAFWEATGSSGNEAGLRRYLERYPNGAFAEQARQQLNQLGNARAQEIEREWNETLNANTIDDYEDFIEDYPNSDFANTARARINDLRAAQQQANQNNNNNNNGNNGNAGGNQDATAQAQAEENALGLNSINRALAQIRLQALGYQVGNVSGSFDAQTREALAAFQRDYGLPATGYMNPATVRQLITLQGN